MERVVEIVVGWGIKVREFLYYYCRVFVVIFSFEEVGKGIGSDTRARLGQPGPLLLFSK